MIDRFFDYLIKHPLIDKLFWFFMAILVLLCMGVGGYVLDMAGVFP